MAFEITNLAVPTLDARMLPAARFQLADQTATSGAQAAPTPLRVWRAIIYQKAFTAGTGTVGPIYAIEVADDSAFTSNVRRIAHVQVNRADEQTALLIGMTPFAAGQQYARIVLTLNGTDAATYDALLEGV